MVIYKHTGKIENEKGTDSLFEVAGDQTAISFLPSSVPELQPAGGALVGDVLAEKVNANSGLNIITGTLSFSSNLLLTKRSMMLVLPVLLSPSKTIL